MRIVVNGEDHQIGENGTISDLLRELDVTVKHVAVEVNQRLIPREEHRSHELKENDQLEVVTLVGGG